MLRLILESLFHATRTDKGPCDLDRCRSSEVFFDPAGSPRLRGLPKSEYLRMLGLGGSQSKCEKMR